MLTGDQTPCVGDSSAILTYDGVPRYATLQSIGVSWERDLHPWWRHTGIDRAVLAEASYHRTRVAALAGRGA